MTSVYSDIWYKAYHTSSFSKVCNKLDKVNASKVFTVPDKSTVKVIKAVTSNDSKILINSLSGHKLTTQDYERVLIKPGWLSVADFQYNHSLFSNSKLIKLNGSDSVKTIKHIDPGRQVI